MYGKSVAIFLFCLIILFKNQSRALDNAKECKPAGLNEECPCGQCLPGLFCDESKYCKIDTASCHSHQWTNAIWKPKCEEDGSYSAVQCKGEYSNGRCFCYSSTGSRIFGWSWWDKNVNNMNCACSRRRHELKKKRADVSLHCAENGNYEPLQCDNGLCWCVESKTGTPSQRVYPESMINYLPCYNSKDIGDQYLRQCESKSVEIAKIVKKVNYHGHKYYDFNNVLCDDDGSYGSYQIDRNVVRCTWKDGKQIEQYQTNVGNVLNTNCNCARDSVIYAQANIEFTLMCEPLTGNYDPHQYFNGRPFCVDQDGFATTDLGDVGEVLQCPK